MLSYGRTSCLFGSKQTREEAGKLEAGMTEERQTLCQLVRFFFLLMDIIKTEHNLKTK